MDHILGKYPAVIFQSYLDCKAGCILHKFWHVYMGKMPSLLLKSSSVFIIDQIKVYITSQWNEARPVPLLSKTARCIVHGNQRSRLKV